MKKTLSTTIAILLFTLVSFSQKSTYVNGYTRSNGTYVQGHYRSNPNYTKADNYSTSGNVNPYTGSVGTKTYSNYNNYGRSNTTYSNYNSGPSYNTAPTYITQVPIQRQNIRPGDIPITGIKKCLFHIL